MSCALALVLACGLVPSQALSTNAYAASGDGATAVAAESSGQESAQVEGAADASGTSANGADAGSTASDSAAADRISQDVALDASSSAAAGADASATDQQASSADGAAQAGAQSVPGSAGNSASVNAEDILSVQVNVGGDDEAASTAIAFGGLVYALNDDGENTVTLTGWTGTAPQGALSIPETIRNGQTDYTVTRIAPAQSATQSAAAESAPTANPYTTELFASAAKAPGVTSVQIPAGATSVDPAFFQMFPNAASIEVAAGNVAYTSENGMLFGANEAAEPTSLLLVPEGMEGAAVLPLTVATVPACVFTRCTKLTAIVFPNGSTGSDSFSVQDGILYTADKATLIAAPAGIGSSVALAPEAQQIAEGAFWGNSALDTIVVQSTVEGIVVNPVFDAAALTTENETSEGDTAVAPVPAFMPQVVEDATVALTGDFNKGAWEAAGFTRFTEPAQPGATIEPVEGSGFAFELLADYTLAVRWMGEDAAPAALRIPSYGVLDGAQYTVSAIAESGFAKQTEIVTVDMPETITVVGAGAFEGCSSLQTVNLPSAVTSINQRAFMGTALRSAVLPSGLETIGAHAFGDLTGTMVVMLGEPGLVSDAAFEGSAGLSVYVPLREDGAYAVSAGLPASGNHIYPYGVQVSSESVQLAEGESANLFEGGYLEAPGAVEVGYAYKARPVSVDTETGDVTAKQVGDSAVQVSLTLDVPTVYVKSIVANEARLKKAALGSDSGTGGLGEVLEVAQTISLTSAAAVYSVSAVSSSVPAAQADVEARDTSEPEYYFDYADSNASFSLHCDELIKVDNHSGTRFTLGNDQAGTFRGKISWSGGTEDGPSAGSSVFVEIPEAGWTYHPAFLSKEIYQFRYCSIYGYGAAKRLKGFRFNTGSYISIDTLMSGKKCAFSFVIPESGLYADDGFQNPKTTSSPKLRLMKTEGIMYCDYEETGTLDENGKLTNGSAAVYFAPNGGRYRNTDFMKLAAVYPTVTYESTYTTAVWSELGKSVYTPETYLYRSGYLFKGWVDEKGNPLPETMTADMAGKTYYANWEVASNIHQYDYTTGNIAKLKIHSTEMIAKDAAAGALGNRYTFGSDESWGSFKGVVTWTGGTASGPGAGSLVTIDVSEAGMNYHPAFITTEIYRNRISNNYGYGPVRQLKGFKFNSGSYISIEKLMSGSPFTFSFYIPDSGLVSPDSLNIPTQGEGATKTADLSILYTPGIMSIVDEETGTLDQNSKLTSGSAAVYFSPNGGQFRNSSFYSQRDAYPDRRYDSNSSYLSAVWSELDSNVLTPTEYLYRTGYGFIGWADASGNPLPSTMTADLAGKTYYAQWAEVNPENVFDYSTAATASMQIHADEMIKIDGVNGERYTFGSDDAWGAFRGKISWTGGDKNGPVAGSTVIVEVPEGGITYHDAFLTSEIYKYRYASAYGFGPAQDLIGFRFNTGSVIYIDTLMSGNAFSFSFTIPATGLNTGKAGSDQIPAPSKTARTKIRLMYTPGIMSCIANTTGILNDKGALTSGSAAVYFSSNQGIFKNIDFESLTVTYPWMNYAGSANSGYLCATWSTLGEPVNTPETYMYNPNYTFVGWFTDPGLSGGEALPATMQADMAGKRYYARWVSITDPTFTLKYNSNTGSGAISDVYPYVGIGATTLSSGSGFSKPGYAFAGWNTKADGSGLSFSGSQAGISGASFTDRTVDRTSIVTLYAQWKPVEYQIVLSTSGKTGVVGLPASNPKVAVEKTAAVTSNTPWQYTLLTSSVVKMKGYTFDGWYTTSTFKDGTKLTGSIDIRAYVPGLTQYDVANAGLLVDDALTLYAKWTEKTYTVHFRSSTSATSDLTGVAAQKVNYESTSTAAGGTATTATVTLPNQYAALSTGDFTGQYYTQWGTRASGTAASAGNLIRNYSTNVSMKTIIDGYSATVEYIPVPSGSTIYDVTDIYLYPQWEYIEYTLGYAQNLDAANGDGKPKGNVALPAAKQKITYRADGVYLNGVKQASGIALGDAVYSGEGYAQKGWAKAATDTATLPATLTRDNFDQFFDLTYDSTHTSTVRTQSITPLWDEFTYNVTLHNTAPSSASSATSTVATAKKYHESVALTLPTTFTAPNGMEGLNWCIDAEGASSTTGVDATGSTTAIATLVGLSANKGSATAAADLHLYIQWSNMSGLKYTVYYVYEGTGTTDKGTYPATKNVVSANVLKREYTGKTNGDAISLTDADKIPDASKIGFEFDDETSTLKNAGTTTVDGNDSVLYAFFKKQYTVSFTVGDGGAYTDNGGKFSQTYTYTHANGADAGTATKMSVALAERAAVAPTFEDPIAGYYLEGYVLSSNLGGTPGTISGTLDIDRDYDYTALFDQITYRVKYQHNYDASKGMVVGTPNLAPGSDAKLADLTFTYDELDDGATLPVFDTMVNDSTKFMVPVGYQHTGWLNGTTSLATTEAISRDASADTFADKLGFTAAPDSAHPAYQEVTLKATWDYREYTVKFWQYAGMAGGDELAVANWPTGTLTLASPTFKMPAQGAASGDPSVDGGVMFGYALTGWSTISSTTTGTLSDTAQTTFVPGTEYGLKHLLFNRDLKKVAEEPEGGVINVFAAWTPVYSVTVPVKTEAFNINLAEGTVDQEQEVTLQSNTPRDVSMRAHAEVLKDDTADEPWKESSAAQLFVKDLTIGEDAIKSALSAITLDVTGSNGKTVKLPLGDEVALDSDDHKTAIASIVAATSVNDPAAQETASIGLTLPAGQWVNPDIGSSPRVGEDGATFYRDWDTVARIVWTVSFTSYDRRFDTSKWLYDDETEAYPTE